MKVNNKKIVDNLVSFLEKKNITNPQVIVSDNDILITANIYNFNTITMALIPIACLLIYPNTSEASSKLIVIAAIPISAYFLWMDFNSINTARIDIINKNITIRSKNIIKKLFNQESVISFNDITDVKYDSVNFNPRFRRYRIILYTNNSDHSIIMTDSKQESTAIYFCQFLNNIIKTNR